LEERFDQFNILKIYKEKEMADFRKWILALSVLALVFTGVAGAQVSGGGATTMTCTAQANVPPQIRDEGFTELIGDITLTCSGGAILAQGDVIPQANIVIQAPGPITSRLIGSTCPGPTCGASEALLLIDEPNSGLAGLGPTLPQMICTTPASGCQADVGEELFEGNEYLVPVQPGTDIQAPNVFQGVINPNIPNQLTFFGVPILAPVTAGDSRVYRITNVRINATGLANSQALLAYVSFSNYQVSVSGYPTVGYAYQSLTGSFRDGLDNTITKPVQLPQCISQTLDPVGYLRFTELFGTAFKTRVNGGTGGTSFGDYWPDYNTVTPANFVQNVPGEVYNGESGFYSAFPAFDPGASDPGMTLAANSGAGVADYGTRLKATFGNLPAGVSVYVSTVNVNDGNTTATGGAAEPWGNYGAAHASPELAYLVAAGVENSASWEVPVDPFTAVASTATATGASWGAPVVLLPQSGGASTAIWEVVQTLPNTQENYDFGVYVTYSAGILPSTGITATLTYAPTPNPSGSEPFTATAAGQPSSTLTIPRFAYDPAGSSTAFLQVTACNTVLLFPYITSAGNVEGVGFDTGISIANTSLDPFGTSTSNGTCTLYWYGGTPDSASTTVPTVIVTTLGSGGANTSGNILQGTVAVTTAFEDDNIPANWSGYMIASCNFQYAHGYAVVTDIGVRNIMSSYLALIVNNPGNLSNIRSPGGFQASEALNN